MSWKSARIILASTVTLIITSKLATSLYRYFFSSKKDTPSEETCRELLVDDLGSKNHEINDVILFSDDLIRQSIKVPSKKKILDSRKANCVKLIKYLNSARETLDVCMYLITSNEIVQQIIKLGQRHIIVRIIVDCDMADTPPSQINRLREFSFIHVQTNEKSILMHHKFCIIDGPKALKRKSILMEYAEKLNVHADCIKMERSKPKNVKGIVMSGSLNWSTQAMASNHDSVIVTSHPSIVSKFEKEFDSLWVEKEPAVLASKQNHELDMLRNTIM